MSDAEESNRVRRVRRVRRVQRSGRSPNTPNAFNAPNASNAPNAPTTGAARPQKRRQTQLQQTQPVLSKRAKNDHSPINDAEFREAMHVLDRYLPAQKVQEERLNQMRKITGPAKKVVKKWLKENEEDEVDAGGVTFVRTVKPKLHLTQDSIMESPRLNESQKVGVIQDNTKEVETVSEKS